MYQAEYAFVMEYVTAFKLNARLLTDGRCVANGTEIIAVYFGLLARLHLFNTFWFKARQASGFARASSARVAARQQLVT